MSKIWKIAGGLALVVLVAMQFHQPARTNPESNPGASFEAAVQPPPEVASSLKRACHDCHSNQTAWPWYSKIAPASWLIASDVNEGREHLNLSEWTQPSKEGETPDTADLCEQVITGKMPLPSYRLMHPGAKLSQMETAALCALQASEETN